jgi:glutathione peroxidase
MTTRFHTLRRTLPILFILSGLIFLYVEAVNKNSKKMTARQKIIRAIYPALMGLSRLFGGREKEKSNPAAIKAPLSFYTLTAIGNDGKEMRFETWRGKKVLIVNTASDCGYTPQYKELQQLYEQYQDKLIILGFPANDFKEQEKGNDQEIAKFCQVNYGVRFPLAQKSSVIKSPRQNPVFSWLSDKKKNGWNNQQPTWNFSKYLVNENGVLTNYFDPAISPLSEQMINAIGQ